MTVYFGDGADVCGWEVVKDTGKLMSGHIHLMLLQEVSLTPAETCGRSELWDSNLSVLNMTQKHTISFLYHFSQLKVGLTSSQPTF